MNTSDFCIVVEYESIENINSECSLLLTASTSFKDAVIGIKNIMDDKFPMCFKDYYS